MKARSLLHDDDIVMVFEATQESRHRTLIEANAVARKLVDIARARVAGQPADEDGVLPEPQRLRVIVGFEHADITTKQRNFLNGVVFTQIAEQYVFPDGTRFAMEVWKEAFRARFLGFVYELRRDPRWDSKLGAWVMPKRATPHKVRVSTESLDIKGYSQYIDRVIATAVTEYGVAFEFRPSEREAVRYRRPIRKADPLALQAPQQAESETA